MEGNAPSFPTMLQPLSQRMETTERFPPAIYKTQSQRFPQGIPSTAEKVEKCARAAAVRSDANGHLRTNTLQVRAHRDIAIIEYVL
jgi:hypothetical protein